MTDCGLYVLHFVEEFFKDPEHFTEYFERQRQQQDMNKHHKGIANLDWDSETLRSRRKALHDLIAKLAEEWKPIRQKQKQEEQAEKKRKREARRAQQEEPAGGSRPESDADTHKNNEHAASKSNCIEIDTDEESLHSSSPVKSHSKEDPLSEQHQSADGRTQRQGVVSAESSPSERPKKKMRAAVEAQSDSAALSSSEVGAIGQQRSNTIHCSEEPLPDDGDKVSESPEEADRRLSIYP